MIYTPMTKKALRLCYEAHAGQLDKSGMPYVLHPVHLAEQMTDEDTTIVALLHDVVEDTAYTLRDFADMGFAPQVIRAIGRMTHDDAVPYLDYVAAIKEDPIARQVKLADLRQIVIATGMKTGNKDDQPVGILRLHRRVVISGELILPGKKVTFPAGLHRGGKILRDLGRGVVANKDPVIDQFGCSHGNCAEDKKYGKNDNQYPFELGFLCRYHDYHHFFDRL